MESVIKAESDIVDVIKPKQTTMTIRFLWVLLFIILSFFAMLSIHHHK